MLALVQLVLRVVLDTQLRELVLPEPMMLHVPRVPSGTTPQMVLQLELPQAVVLAVMDTPLRERVLPEPTMVHVPYVQVVMRVPLLLALAGVLSVL